MNKTDGKEAKIIIKRWKMILAKDIVVNNLKISFIYGLIISLWFAAIGLNNFEYTFHDNTNLAMFTFLQILAVIFFLSIIFTFILVIFAYISEIKQFDKLLRNKILKIKSPYRFFIIFLSSLLLISFFFFPTFLFLLNTLSYTLGLGIGIALGALFFRIKLHTNESILEMKIEKKYYFILTSNKFPYIANVKIKNGQIKPQFNQSFLLILSIILSFMYLISSLIPPSRSDFLLLDSYGFLNTDYDLGKLYYLFNILIDFNEIYIEKIVLILYTIHFIINFITILIVFRNYSRYKNFQWMQEFIPNILKKMN
ncbi:MAG: hypothetical protein ACFFCM_15675 [Promethearchaeota archaeon]